jgi:hypothetical protein
MCTNWGGRKLRSVIEQARAELSNAMIKSLLLQMAMSAKLGNWLLVKSVKLSALFSEIVG